MGGSTMSVGVEKVTGISLVLHVKSLGGTMSWVVGSQIASHQTALVVRLSKRLGFDV